MTQLPFPWSTVTLVVSFLFRAGRVEEAYVCTVGVTVCRANASVVNCSYTQTFAA
jgi:hypothetical protein